MMKWKEKLSYLKLILISLKIGWKILIKPSVPGQNHHVSVTRVCGWWKKDLKIKDTIALDEKFIHEYKLLRKVNGIHSNFSDNVSTRKSLGCKNNVSFLKKKQ